MCVRVCVRVCECLCVVCLCVGAQFGFSLLCFGKSVLSQVYLSSALLSSPIVDYATPPLPVPSPKMEEDAKIDQFGTPQKISF